MQEERVKHLKTDPKKDMREVNKGHWGDFVEKPWMKLRFRGGKLDRGDPLKRGEYKNSGNEEGQKNTQKGEKVPVMKGT